MRVLLDMNLPPKLAESLIKNGIDSVHWYHIGAPNAKDTEIMKYARDNDYIVMSSDKMVDFSLCYFTTVQRLCEDCSCVK